MHVHTPPEPPSVRAGVPIPPALEAIVMACLAKDPVARPQTAEELARRLAEVPLARTWTAERAQAWWAANRTGPTPSKAEVIASMPAGGVPAGR